jgi:hypothetical protein
VDVGLVVVDVGLVVVLVVDVGLVVVDVGLVVVLVEFEVEDVPLVVSTRSAPYAVPAAEVATSRKW